jgi:hypothetical protein
MAVAVCGIGSKPLKGFTYVGSCRSNTRCFRGNFNYHPESITNYKFPEYAYAPAPTLVDLTI